MKKTILTIVNIFAFLAFFVGIAGIDAGHFLAASIVTGISLGWMFLFLYANGREHEI